MLLPVVLIQHQRDDIESVLFERKRKMIDCGSVNARIKEFDIRHGDNPVCLNSAWLLFEDGAKRETNPLGPLVEPPEDSWQRSQAVARYWEVKTQLAVEEFNNLRQNLLAHCKTMAGQKISAPPPSEQELARLITLKKKVHKYQRQLHEALENVEASKPEGLKQKEEMYEENRQANLAYLNRVSEIEV
jgi:hypothetical protein